MATVVIMPKQGQSVESCILTEVKKKKGENVTAGDVLFSYETDKAAFEEESQVNGTVLEVFYNEGDEIPVLANVMVIGKPAEPIEEFKTESPVEEKPDIIQQETEQTIETPFIQETPASISPRARQLAEKHTVNYTKLTGTGPHGRIIERDIQAAIDASPKATPLAKAMIKKTNASLPETGSGLAGTAKSIDLRKESAIQTSDSVIKPLTNMRKIIAKSMYASLQNSAQLTHHLGADARNIMSLRKKVKAAMQKGFKEDITINDFVCFAVIKALQQFPQANSHFLEDRLRVFSKVHLGLAVDTERGLMVPTVKSADSLSLQELSNELKEIANACKEGQISPDLLSPSAASFTVSNLGNYGVEIFTPVINLPQVAILGVNTIVARPKDLGGGVYGFVPYMGLSLTYDHRALDGGEATRFLKQIAIEIENLKFDI